MQLRYARTSTTRPRAPWHASALHPRRLKPRVSLLRVLLSCRAPHFSFPIWRGDFRSILDYFRRSRIRNSDRRVPALNDANRASLRCPLFCEREIEILILASAVFSSPATPSRRRQRASRAFVDLSSQPSSINHTTCARAHLKRGRNPLSNRKREA